MGTTASDGRRARVRFGQRFRRLPAQLARRSPFSGSISPGRVRLIALGSGRPSLPFPHPWNYREPLRILETYFWGADECDAGARHNRYLDAPGFAPVLVTRDPRLIRAISAATGDRDGMFDRDTMPSIGIARATGADTLLYANGSTWKRQKKLATPPFARTTLFQPERFDEFEQIFRRTAVERLALAAGRVGRNGGPVRVRLEDEVKAVMLEMLVNGFFGAEIEYDEIRQRYVPALERVISHIVRDTVVNRIGAPLQRLPALTRRSAEIVAARRDFERLTDLAVEQRRAGRGLWGQFQSDAPDDALRSNIRVFLAGALEATTSYASWALSHLSRDEPAQERVFAEVAAINEYTPDTLAAAKQLGCVLHETLRLTPSLYFHPRRATTDTLVEVAPDETLGIPKGTHILLDVWHANRHEDHWGVEATGHPAAEFAPQRWERFADAGRGSNDALHFGFGHGPRFCPGKSLGQLEVALVVGACVKLFRFRAATTASGVKAGVSTKPADGVLVDLWPRSASEPPAAQPSYAAPAHHGASSGPRCPFAGRSREA